MSTLDKNEIVNAIENAMKVTLEDIEKFVNDYTQGIQAEYLFTVNMAKVIAGYNELPANEYKVKLERKTRVFAVECLPRIVRKLGGKDKEERFRNLKFDKVVKYENIGDKYRNGRVDLVIYDENHNSANHFNDCPLCAIEVKAFNPKPKDIIADLERNMAFLTLEADLKEGKKINSVLEFSAFAAFHWDKRFKIGNIDGNTEFLMEKYNEILKTVGDYKLIEKHDPIVKPLGVYEGDIDYDDYGQESIDKKTAYQIFGVIIIFSKITPIQEEA